MGNLDFNDKIKKECIIAFKVYDQCRQQDCLTPKLLGPARSGEPCPVTVLGVGCPEIVASDNNAPIDPPNNAAAVVIVPGTFNLHQIVPINKEIDPFRTGYYNIELKFVFEYRLQFRNSDGTPITLTGSSCPTDMLARSIYNKTVSLFGSTGQNISIYTDFAGAGNSLGLNIAPFELVEANAIPLKTTLGYVTPIAFPGVVLNSGLPIDNAPTANKVDVTIGLFTIIKLFRLVNLNVESKGFCRPHPCTDTSSDPCDYFSNLDFPFDAFDPPQKKDFFKHSDDCLDDDDDSDSEF